MCQANDKPQTSSLQLVNINQVTRKTIMANERLTIEI